MNVQKVFDDAHREHYIIVQLSGLDCKASLVRDDASQIVNYVRTLAATPSIDAGQRDKVSGSIAAARMALAEALLAVKLCEIEYRKVTARKQIKETHNV